MDSYTTNVITRAPHNLYRASFSFVFYDLMHWLISISPTLTPPTLLSTCPTKPLPLDGSRPRRPVERGGRRGGKEGGSHGMSQWIVAEALDPGRKARRGVLEAVLCCY